MVMPTPAAEMRTNSRAPPIRLLHHKATHEKQPVGPSPTLPSPTALPEDFVNAAEEGSVVAAGGHGFQLCGNETKHSAQGGGAANAAKEQRASGMEHSCHGAAVAVQPRDSVAAALSQLLGLPADTPLPKVAAPVAAAGIEVPAAACARPRNSVEASLCQLLGLPCDAPSPQASTFQHLVPRAPFKALVIVMELCEFGTLSDSIKDRLFRAGSGLGARLQVIITRGV